MRSSLLLLFSVLILIPDGFSTSILLKHDWNTVGSMIYAHGSSSDLASTQAIDFMAQHYSMVTFGNGYGGYPVENHTLSTSRQLKARNETIKVIFYWKTISTEQILTYSSANSTFLKHPEWFLKDDHGNTLDGFLDLTNPDVCEFWINHCVEIAKEIMSGSSKPVIDGFFIDGNAGDPTKPGSLANVSDARFATIIDAMYNNSQKLQHELDQLGMNQFVLINGLDTEWALERHAASASFSMVDHFAILQFIDSKTGEMIPDAMENLLFNVTATPQNKNRTLQIKGWPGPIIRQRDQYPNNTQPTTPKEFQETASRYFNNALSYFLIIAEDNMWWSYSWFWRLLDVEPFDPQSTCPTEFYPELNCPLGSPKGPARNIDRHVWARDFEFAHVQVNLNSRNQSFVKFLRC